MRTIWRTVQQTKKDLAERVLGRPWRFRREVQCNECSGSPGKGQIFLPPSPPSAGFRGCEGGSGERKIEKVQSAQALHFASEFRP